MKFSNIHTTVQKSFNQAFKVKKVDVSDISHFVSPVLNIDHFEMASPYFPPHPHAGFSAVTYMLEDSDSGFLNRDSLGDVSEINPGDIHWTLAGSGVIHEEVPKEAGKVANGIQLFVKLEKEHEFMDPKSFHVQNSKAPRVNKGDAQIKILSGEFEGEHAPFNLPSPFNFYDVQLQSSGKVDLEVEENFGGLLYILDGNVYINHLSEEKESEALKNEQFLSKGQYIGLSSEKSLEKIRIHSFQGARFLFLSGRRQSDQVYSAGPFALNDPLKIQDVQRRYQSGQLGYLKASF